MAGTVRDADGQPLPGASVYLSGTTRGDAADAEGRYRIPAVTPGTYRLVGSMVGFTADVREVQLPAGQELQLDLKLTPSISGVGSLVVEAPDDPLWRQRLAQFTVALLGETVNAHLTRILNPEVLDFTSSLGTLRATAAAPLVIENRALGYRLRYDLHEFSDSGNRIRFDGDEVFEEIGPASDTEAREWAAARERAWRGSRAHLFRSLIEGTAEAEGFSLALDQRGLFGRGPKALTRDGAPPTVCTPDQPVRVVRLSARRVVGLRDGVHVILESGVLWVRYEGEPEEPGYLTSRLYPGSNGRRGAPWRTFVRWNQPKDDQVSQLHIGRPGMALDADGTPVDWIATSGYMAFERLANRVPRDYALDPPGGV